jgi:hypothetical protein
MSPPLSAVLLFVFLVAVVFFSRKVRTRLPEHHLSADSRDAVKLAMGLVATMTALLLGLLVSSAKAAYDAERNEVIQMAAKVAFMDRVLTLYGPEATAARVQFRDAVGEVIRHLWPEERGAAPQLNPGAEAGDTVYILVQQLAPRDDTQRGLKAQAATLAVELGQLRALLAAQATPSLSKPLLLAVVCWLAVIFSGFSLLAPPHATSTVALGAAAFSVAGAVFLILELDQPLGGLIRISSEPMVAALAHLAK